MYLHRVLMHATGAPYFGGENLRSAQSAAVRLKPTSLVATRAMSPHRRPHWLVRLASQVSACEKLMVFTPGITYLHVHPGHQAHRLEAKVPITRRRRDCTQDELQQVSNSLGSTFPVIKILPRELAGGPAVRYIVSINSMHALYCFLQTPEAQKPPSSWHVSFKSCRLREHWLATGQIVRPTITKPPGAAFDVCLVCDVDFRAGACNIPLITGQVSHVACIRQQPSMALEKLQVYVPLTVVLQSDLEFLFDFVWQRDKTFQLFILRPIPFPLVAEVTTCA